MDYEKKIIEILNKCKHGRGSTLKELFFELEGYNKKTVWKYLKRLVEDGDIKKEVQLIKVYKKNC